MAEKPTPTTASIGFHRAGRALTGWTVLFLLVFFPPTAVFAIKKDDMTQYRQKLETLQKSIRKVQQHLQGDRKKHGNIITELQALEAEISENTRAIKQLATQIDQLASRQQQLERERERLDRQLRQHREQLATQLQAAYRMGHQQQLKMILNQQHPADIARMQQYFGYLARAREQAIRQFLASLRDKQRVDEALAETLQRHRQALDRQQRNKRSRLARRRQRQQLVAQIKQRIANQENTLAELENSRSRIENLLKSLGELLADIPAGPSDAVSFGHRKGQLPWPGDGRLLAHFGQPKGHGQLKWKGVLIEADYGAPVAAIGHGRVAFADWLQGFGFITIVDHGDGFMSLYGQSESLFKQVGDWVQAGEVIATAGDSGGQETSGIYFEIRARGKPVDPEHWCDPRRQRK